MALRRMYRRDFLVGVSATAAASILAACSGSNQAVELPTKTPAPAGATSVGATSASTTGQASGAAPTVAGQASPAAAPANSSSFRCQTNNY